MRISHLASAIILLLFSAAPVAAVPTGAYLGGRIGMFLPIESNLYGTFPGGSGRLTYDPGLALTATGGYQLASGFRLEAEVDYRHLTTDRLYVGEGIQQVRGEISSIAAFTTLYYDFLNTTPVTPFAGGGIGFASTHFSRATTGSTLLWPAGRDTSVAYQWVGGFSLTVTEATCLDFSYHHYAIPRIHLPAVSAEFRGPNLSIGLRHWF